MLDGSEWSASRPCRFTPGKELRTPFYRSLGNGCGGEKIFLLIPGFEARTVLHKRVATRLRYTFIVLYINVNDSYCFGNEQKAQAQKPFPALNNVTSYF